MVCSGMRIVLSSFLILLVLLSGCTDLRQQENGTPGQPEVQGVPAEYAASPAPVLSPVVTTETPREPEMPVRKTVNVLRGEPFTVNGSVKDRSITEVQVWMLNDTTSTRRVPVRADGSFQISMSPEETNKLSRTFTSALIIQYPSPPDHFTVNHDAVSGNVTGTGTTPERILAELNNKENYPTTLADYLDQAITEYGAGNSCEIYFMNGIDAWIAIDPIYPTPPGTMTVSGTTSLPAGSLLSISVVTAYFHPSSKNYDWSHEIAEGSVMVVPGSNGINTFSGIVDTARLNTGKYLVLVESRDEALQAVSNSTADIIAPLPAHPETGNYIDWSRLALPPLAVNETMQPVMLEGDWKIVPRGAQKTNNQVPYGSIIDCAPDGICRVFNQSGVQFLAVYNSNEAHRMEVPNGAAGDDGTIGNVSRISLNGEVILTKINEQGE
ncbi:MAG: hypothetical protein M0R30_06245 [Methanoregula sp.]|jgi:hypothetical protein|uniref:hypothetical protein n=1 Tax=Methanoregula sp. TaxID=2052170 RepID=UPI0025D472B8|nr:hypothetical protein [Methanoregula sp.]MCK9631227.1 hypothetical protein [Methanoregula sp.]